MLRELLEGLEEELILFCLPDGPALDLEDVEQLVLQEVDLLAPEGLADVPPVLLAPVNELNRVNPLIMDETDNKPNIQPPLVLVPPARKCTQRLVLVPT